MRIFQREVIQNYLDPVTALDRIEEGFVIYSNGGAVIPPVATLHFDHPPGDCHIKYGYAKQGKYYVVKIASGFYNNFHIGLPAGNGLMLLFDQVTGKPACILLDEGYLTDFRTAAAGCIAAKYLAPKIVKSIGIVGTGAQALFQLKLLQLATSCREVLVWGRNKEKAENFCASEELSPFNIRAVDHLSQLTSSCNLIVTTTSSQHPLLFAEMIHSGTHITAVGADDAGKQELDPYIYAKADRIVVDSRSQCSLYGDTFHALQAGIIEEQQLLELGQIIATPSLRRTTDDQITIADLTGIAIQDLQIAITAYENCSNNAEKMSNFPEIRL